MTDTRTLRDVTITQARAYDEMVKALDHGNVQRAANLADIVSACTLIRATALPSRSSVFDDILDHGADPYQSETERYWDEKTERRLERD